MTISHRSKNIKYVAFYDVHSSEEKRNVKASAINKIDYISNVLIEVGYCVEIISPSWTTIEEKCEFDETRIELGFNKNLTKLPTRSFGGKLKNKAKMLSSMIHLTKYLMKNLNNDDVLLIYHSNILYPAIKFVKIFKGNEICLEIEEIYQDAQNNPPLLKFFENKLIELGDNFILSTHRLIEKLPQKNNQDSVVVIEGAYKPYNQITKPSINVLNNFSKDKIHVVYAGTFDIRKKGVLMAINAAKNLSSDYHFHIIGFGSEEEIENVKNEIINYQGMAQLTYDGFYSGIEYQDFLSMCDIGVSTQEIEGEYNNSSFPSKILSYMACGLTVVSGKIESVFYSRIGDEITYYDTNEPTDIADAIMRVPKNMKNNNIKTKLLGYDLDIKRELNRMLQE
ncbi:MAG: hypothetical protein C0425_10885 [Chlorobiaceae bacterium]|nr:hypothetical protein [Chlorobiaceae bacterium]